VLDDAPVTFEILVESKMRIRLHHTLKGERRRARCPR
jgi:hypothetical protein